jgi:putative DNA primase/helicase
MRVFEPPATLQVLDAFKAAMSAVGIEPAEEIDDNLRSGQRFYFRATIDKPRQRKAWAVLYLDHRPAGAFGHFKAHLTQRWRFDGETEPNRREMRDLQRKMQEAARRREEEALVAHQAAATQCQERWLRAGPVDRTHSYLVAKGIAGEGLRQDGDALLVPMFDASGTLWNLQAISPNGRKLYAKGARTKGLHLLIGEPAGCLAVAEGYGTAAVIRRATSLPVAVAFSWSNLTDTAKAMRRHFPLADIIIGADDDAHLVEHPTIKRNIGLEAAEAAARAVGGRLAVPPRRVS